MSSYLYSMTNRQSANAVAAMKIAANGSIKFVKGSPFPTGGKGFRATESQNAVWAEKDFVFAVDGGSDSFAVFRRNPDGTLVGMNSNPVPSQGARPYSVCFSNGILYVLNRGNPDAGTPPSLAVFAVEDGNARHLAKNRIEFGVGETPTQVIANKQGTLLAVSSAGPDGSLLYCYRIDAGGAASSGLLTKLEDSPFSISGGDLGFGSAWTSDGKTLFMTNALGDASVVRLSIDAKSGRITEKARVKAAGTACWAGLGNGEKKLYVTNGASVLVYELAPDAITEIQSEDVTDMPSPVVHDLVLGPKAKFLYVIDQRNRRILFYSIGANGRVKRKGELAMAAPSFPLGLAIG